jgi:hypothetical protein
MHTRGITYDTGFASAGTTTHEPFVPEIVQREMQIIHDDLHCNAVRITGSNPRRLEIAAKFAAEAGLEIWFCPFTNGLTQEELFDTLLDCAERAERLRLQDADVVLLAGSEISLFNSGFIPGESHIERLALLRSPEDLRKEIGGIRARINAFLGRTVEAVRARFGGKVSYASIPFEGIDWTGFDIIATDAGYRAAAFAARFRDDIRAFVSQGRAQGKPVAITEFGCATYRGAGDLANRDDSNIEWGPAARPVGLKGEHIRDEEEQSRYLRELLDVFESEGVESVFVYTFARYDLAYRCETDEDFDVVSAGVVKVLEGGHGDRYPDMPWEPKAGFDMLAKFYRERADLPWLSSCGIDVS